MLGRSTFAGPVGARPRLRRHVAALPSIPIEQLGKTLLDRFILVGRLGTLQYVPLLCRHVRGVHLVVVFIDFDGIGIHGDLLRKIVLVLFVRLVPLHLDGVFHFHSALDGVLCPAFRFVGFARRKFGV